MLKTLRITSIITVILAAMGVIAIVVMGLKGDPEIEKYLAKPGIIDELRKKADQEGEKIEKSSPLVALAKAFALRIDPPPPPKPPEPKGQPKPEVARAVPTRPVPPKPKVQTTVKSDLLATVLCESSPKKSLALFKMGANQEWFRQGEKVGHLEIKEIRDGSVVFTQGNEIFVPSKPQVTSFLKSGQETSAAPRTGPGSVTARLTTPDKGQKSQPVGAEAEKAAAAEKTDSGKIRMTRPIDRTSRPRPDVPARITRTRTVPPPPSPTEQKESIENTMSGIEEIMNRQDESVSEEDRKKETEMWKELMDKLNAEKKRLNEAAEAEAPSEKETENSKAEKPKETAGKTTRKAAKPAPAESK